MIANPIPVDTNARGGKKEKTMIRNYLVSAMRSIRKNKINSLVNIFGLSLGLACCLLILLWIRDEMSFDRFHVNFDRIHRVVSDWPKHNWNGMEGTPQPLATEIREHIPEVEETVRMTGQNRKVFQHKDKAFYESRGLIADPSLFHVFSFEFIKGSPSSAFSSPAAMVITESLAGKYFGEEDPMGKVLQVDGKPVVVTGVITDIPQNSSLRFDYVQSFSYIDELSNYGTSWGAFNFNTFVLLRNEADPVPVNRKMTDIARTMKCPQVVDGALFRLQPLSQVHLDARGYTREIVMLGDRRLVSLFSAIAVFILLLACVNYMNLATARAAARSKEVGLRRTVGASRSQLIRQFMGESFLFVSISFVAAVVLTVIFLPVVGRLSGKELHFGQAGINSCGAMAALWIVTALVSGLYPSLILSKFQPSSALKGWGRIQVKGRLFRQVLVVFQFTLTIILLIGTLMMNRQLHFVRGIDLGFDRDNVIQLPIKENVGPHFSAFKNELLQNPRVDSVSAQRYDFAASTWRSSGNFDWEGREGRENLDMVYSGVDFDFFRTMKLPLKAGRSFSPEMATDKENAVILNESAIRAMGIEEPVGKWFSVSKEDQRTIIGVAADARFRTLHNAVEPRVFYLSDMAEADDMGLAMVRIKGGDVGATLKDIGNLWEKYNPVSPFEYAFLDQTYEDLYQKEQSLFAVFNIFTVLAVLISCLGLFGLSSFMTERRTKEIGIRKILGAGNGKIIGILSRDFIRWVLLANIFAWPLGYLLSRKLLQGFAYRAAIGLDVFLVAGLAAGIIAELTILVYAVKSAGLNPADALRCE